MTFDPQKPYKDLSILLPGVDLKGAVVLVLSS